VLKSLAMRALTAPPVARMFWPLLHQRASIFMLHRFAMPDLGVHGLDPAALDTILAELRRRGYRLMDLKGIFQVLAEQREFAGPTVGFTIDDGYLDQAEIAAPVFARYDCPVTTFVTSGFLDGTLWFWWDRIEYLYRHTSRREGAVALGTEQLSYRWNSDDERLAAQADFTHRCKFVPDAEKHAAIGRMAAALEVTLPDAPPAEYGPMSWADLRRCESGGMSFGPHTVTHPVLSRATDSQSRQELTVGWQRLSAEAANPVPVFCYPNGQTGDFGPREFDTLASIGMVGAVVGEPGYADVARFHRGPTEPFTVRRFNYNGDLPSIVRVTSGIEWARGLLRSGA
jgi:peptidoglycan/xylan/chitin deacetylase (PgdA/CDA1 family)